MSRTIVAIVLAPVLAGCGGASMVGTTTDGVADRIPIEVMKPDGPGPFPAVVIVHDCSGLGPLGARAGPSRLRRAAAGQLRHAGVSGRRLHRRLAASGGREPGGAAGDAYAALAHARALPYVDGRRVGLMGGSHGGSTTLASMLAPERDSEALASAKRNGFAAAVALYPSCDPAARVWQSASGVYRPSAPLLILVGEKDDWTPAEPCRRLADAAQKGGHPVALKIYPGAHHSFDSPNPVRYVATRINRNARPRRDHRR